jgi:hypothetical protein
VLSLRIERRIAEVGLGIGLMVDWERNEKMRKKIKDTEAVPTGKEKVEKR